MTRPYIRPQRFAHGYSHRHIDIPQRIEGRYLIAGCFAGLYAVAFLIGLAS